MIDYYKELGHKYSSFTITHAVKAAKESAEMHKPSYYTGEDFEPHLWVVEAIAWALYIGGVR